MALALPALLATTFAVTLGIMTLLWAVSLRRRDASIVDAWWGMGFIVIAVLNVVLGDGYQPRALLLLALVVLWGGRLATDLFKRNLRVGEDPRYAAWRADWGHTFWWRSLLQVFVLQGVLMWTFALALSVAQAMSVPASLGITDVVGTIVILAGIALEATADRQLERFRKDPANKGKLLTTGVWAWSRHPNYFAESVVWWGVWIVALGVPLGLFLIVSPVLLTFFLVKVSGVAMTERRMAGRPGWDAYAAATPAFIPRPPKSGRNLGKP